MSIIVCDYYCACLVLTEGAFERAASLPLTSGNWSRLSVLCDTPYESTKRIDEELEERFATCVMRHKSSSNRKKDANPRRRPPQLPPMPAPRGRRPPQPPPPATTRGRRPPQPPPPANPRRPRPSSPQSPPSPPQPGPSGIGQPAAAPRTQRYRPGSKALKEIRKYQKSTNLLLRKAPFSRLVREVCQVMGKGDLRWQNHALMAVQEASEAFLVYLLSNANLLTMNAKRATLFNTDILLARHLHGLDDM
ncbi:uncharacterized protein LOC144002397 [Festucalex cinctus]